MKLDLILENVRNKYNMGLLEESSLTELDVLKGKVLINESTMQIRKMLVEEGTMENVKAFLEESWSYELYEEALNPQLIKKEIGNQRNALNNARVLNDQFNSAGRTPRFRMPDAIIPESGIKSGRNIGAGAGIGIGSILGAGVGTGMGAIIGDDAEDTLVGTGVGAGLGILAGAGLGSAIGTSIPTKSNEYSHNMRRDNVRDGYKPDGSFKSRDDQFTYARNMAKVHMANNYRNPYFSSTNPNA